MLIIKRNILSLLSLSVCVCFLLASLDLFGATVLKAKKRKKGKKINVILNIEGEDVVKKDRFKVYDNNGKYRGTIRIKRVKGDKAYGYMKKGKAKKGWTAKKKIKKGRKAMAGNDTAHTPGMAPPVGSTYWGLMAGLANSSASVTLKEDNGKVDLVGSSFLVKIIMDFALFDWIWFRGGLGMLNYETEGEINAGCNGEICDTKISYISLDFWGRMIFLDTFRPWIGAGFDLLFPLSKEATALDKSSITNTSVLAVGTGFDWYINPNFYIPLQIEYALFPSSDEVAANYLGVSLGFAMSF